MVLLVTALAFFVLITGLILIHELGHFLAARRFGVVVEEFGFGLPPKIVTVFRKWGTAFTLNAIPFGGFVRLKGENELSSAKGSFAAASVTARSIILIAGVFMNFLLAVVLFTGGFWLGGWVPTYTSIDALKQAAVDGQIRLELGVLIDEVTPAGGAAAAKVPVGSFLKEIDGVPLTDPAKVVEMQKGKKSVSYTLEIPERDAGLSGHPLTTKQTIKVPVTDGRTGIGIREVPMVLEGMPVSLPKALLLALREAKVVMAQTVVGIVHLFGSLARHLTVPDGITGIVGIAQLTHTSVQEGWTVYLRLVALLSLSLAALNILPFPALDGGRLLFVLAEAVRRKPTDHSFEVIANTIGFVLLLGLIVIVTLSDVLRLFS